MKILALMPAYKTMDIPAVQSLVAMQADVYNNGDNINIAFVHGFNTALARNNLFEYAAAQTDIDYVLNIDSDHIYKAKDMYMLIDQIESNNLDMLSAGYYVRGDRNFAHGRFVDDRFKQFKEGEVSGITECDVLGFGFLVMKWDFLSSMVKKFPKDLFKMDIENNTSEDVYFCRKVKEFGSKICFNADIIVGHLTTVVNQ